jgi:hypothetical protein
MQILFLHVELGKDRIVMLDDLLSRIAYGHARLRRRSLEDMAHRVDRLMEVAAAEIDAPRGRSV